MFNLVRSAVGVASGTHSALPWVGRSARPPLEKCANSLYITSRSSFPPEDGRQRADCDRGRRRTTVMHATPETAAERSVNGANGRGRTDGRVRPRTRARNSIISSAVLPVRPSWGLFVVRSLARPSASAATKECGLPTERRGGRERGSLPSRAAAAAAWAG